MGGVFRTKIDGEDGKHEKVSEFTPHPSRHTASSGLRDENGSLRKRKSEREREKDTERERERVSIFMIMYLCFGCPVALRGGVYQ